MSAAKHTPGALSITGPSKPRPDTPEGGDFALLDSEGEIIAETFARVSAGDDGVRPAEANARRIVACWNACDGISTADLEASPHLGLLHLAEFSNAIVQQRDELLAALKAVQMDAVGIGSKENAISDATRDLVDAAIAKVEASK